MARLTSFVLRHRRLVAIFWLAVFVAAMAGSSRVSDRLAVDFSLPGQPGSTTAAEITQLYGNGGSLAPSVEVVTVAQGQSVAQNQAKIAAAFDAVRQGSPALRVVDY